MWHVALQVVVDRDITVGCLHASGSQIERIHVARPTSRKEDRVYSQAGGTLLLAVVQANAAIDLFQPLGSGTGNDRHVLLLEGIGQCHRDILIFLGKKPRGKLEQVHLAAEILEDRRQLAAGGCSTNNRYARGQLLE